MAPLQWGLGHATRCIPLIKQLINQNCEVYIAAEGAAYSLLKQEFGEITFLPLMGYNIQYSRKKYFLPWKIFAQLPKIIFTIYKEHQWIKKIAKEYKIDAVISDNRFGMYHSKITSIYITHQLVIKTGNSLIEKIGKKIHFYFINKYTECWVPDFAQRATDGEINGLAGDLSHPKNLPKNIKYLGALSRFELYTAAKKYDLLISISGPEPQRTIFENKILSDLQSYSGKILFLRGLPNETATLKIKNSGIEIKNHLSGMQLNEAILQSNIVISRCGYTTIMDLLKLQKNAILIPTPGQTEQEYLAKYVKEKNIFYTISQKDFDLQNVLKQAGSFSFNIPEYNMEQYKSVVNQFVQSLINVTLQKDLM